MDHPCHKCAQLVEDGVPFCRYCGAPQIRVAIAEAPGAATPEFAALSTAPPIAASPSEVPASLLAIQWDHALPACGIAAAAGALLMVMGLMVPVLAMLGTGFLATMLYRRRAVGSLLRASTGAQLGSISGVFCFGITAILGAIRVALFNWAPALRSKLLEVIDQAASRADDPQAQQIFDYFKTPPGMAVMVMFFLFFALIFFVFLSGIGGALGAAILGRKK